MLVRQCMATDVVTVQEDTPVSEALQMMKQRRIRKLPVMRGDKLVGIVTDRDLRDITPSKATSLDVWELNYLLAKLTVKDAMVPNPVTIGPDESVAKAALLMQENHFECLPVVDHAELVGIVTESDVFRSFVTLSGVRDGGVEIVLELEDRSGTLKDVGNIIREHGLKIRSILCHYEGVKVGYRHVSFRVMGEDVGSLVERLQGTHKVIGVSTD